MFDNLDAVLLARIQFAFTVSFHFIFPSFSIGLASYLAVLEGLWLKTGKSVYLDLFKYWLKIFAVVFAMGVVSGIVMSYRFGTNWSVFSVKTGPVLGPLMAYEVLTAFFLEAGFLGVMLFGMSLNRGSERLPFAIALGLFLLGFAGLGISLFPCIVPDQITIWDAAAPPSSQMFMLVGTVIIVPIILAYTAWAYRVFRGKVGTHGYY